jgi:dihydropteroate synthase
MQKTSNTLRIKGQLLDLSQPKIMGILNLNSDSFYTGSRIQAKDQLLFKAEEMLQEGADFLDLGAMSSRPGATEMPLEWELERLIPALQTLRAAFPQTLISVDTYRGQVALEAAAQGADLINDISAGQLDPELLPAVAQTGLPYVLMHLRGRPSTMQNHTQYDDLLTEITDFFLHKLQQLKSLGIHEIILDLGFGFGKDLDQNYQLLKHLSNFHWLGYPILVGISRKSMIYKLLNHSPEQALNGSSVLHFWALQQGAQFLRVHDVKAAKEVITLWHKLQTS